MGTPGRSPAGSAVLQWQIHGPDPRLVDFDLIGSFYIGDESRDRVEEEWTASMRHFPEPNSRLDSQPSSVDVRADFVRMFGYCSPLSILENALVDDDINNFILMCHNNLPKYAALNQQNAC